MASESQKGTRKALTILEKNLILDEYYKSGATAAAKKFDVGRRHVYNLKEQEDKLRAASESCQHRKRIMKSEGSKADCEGGATAVLDPLTSHAGSYSSISASGMEDAGPSRSCVKVFPKRRKVDSEQPDIEVVKIEVREPTESKHTPCIATSISDPVTSVADCDLPTVIELLSPCGAREMEEDVKADLSKTSLQTFTNQDIEDHCTDVPAEVSENDAPYQVELPPPASTSTQSGQEIQREEEEAEEQIRLWNSAAGVISEMFECYMEMDKEKEREIEDIQLEYDETVRKKRESVTFHDTSAYKQQHEIELLIKRRDKKIRAVKLKYWGLENDLISSYSGRLDLMQVEALIQTLTYQRDTKAVSFLRRFLQHESDIQTLLEQEVQRTRRLESQAKETILRQMLRQSEEMVKEREREIEDIQLEYGEKVRRKNENVIFHDISSIIEEDEIDSAIKRRDEKIRAVKLKYWGLENDLISSYSGRLNLQQVEALILTLTNQGDSKAVSFLRRFLQHESDLQV